MKQKLNHGQKIGQEIKQLLAYYTEESELSRVNFYYCKETDNYWHFAIKKPNLPPKLYQMLKNPIIL